MEKSYFLVGLWNKTAKIFQFLLNFDINQVGPGNGGMRVVDSWQLKVGGRCQFVGMANPDELDTWLNYYNYYSYYNYYNYFKNLNISLDNHLFAIIDIDAFSRGCAYEFASIEGVPSCGICVPATESGALLNARRLTEVE